VAMDKQRSETCPGAAKHRMPWRVSLSEQLGSTHANAEQSFWISRPQWAIVAGQYAAAVVHAWIDRVQHSASP
jgi:hypothetical protein